YMKLTVGVPQSHITRLQDASLSEIKFALNRIKEITEAYEGDAKIIVHYSGHGIPDESKSEGYLLPADGFVSDPTTAFKLSDLYATLGNLNAKSLILFLDACFSGAQRSGDMLASARGVSIKVKEEKPVGNLVVISAAQGDQTAYPYKSKEHGMMTYFLLKKLQETSGNVKLGELSDYITAQVKRTSLVENEKSQIPATIVDDSNENWRNQTLR
ncbi:MAG: caspase family protein, partial [Muribaculaceae bacterium]|nr:caspase family protein [Muribaculaceae bacterium]